MAAAVRTGSSTPWGWWRTAPQMAKAALDTVTTLPKRVAAAISLRVGVDRMAGP